MSNSYSVNPIRIDSTFGTISTTAPIGYKSQVKNTLGSPLSLTIEKLVWTGPGAVGNTVSLNDPISGIVLFQLTCGTANQEVTLEFNAKPRMITDFMCSEIDSGVLWIYAKGI